MVKLQKFQEIIARFSPKERVLFYVAFMFVLLTTLDLVVVRPIFSKISSLDKEIKEKLTGLRKDTHILSQAKRVEALKKKYASYLTSVRSEDEEIISLLKEVEALANKNSISLADLKPGGSNKEGDASVKFLVNLNFEAQMEQLINFIYSIENSDRLLSVEKYQIAPKSKELNVVQCAMTVSRVAIP